MNRGSTELSQTGGGPGLPWACTPQEVKHPARKIVRVPSEREQPVPEIEVVIIGAGPFGVSISAHLTALGVEHLIVGRPMEAWRSNMPAGMTMKSEPYASTIASPGGKYDVAAYCASHGLDYVDRVGPLSRQRFLDYADWYTEQLVPGLRDQRVTEVTRVDGAFRVSFADAAPVVARQVVVATGVIPYQYLPAELAGLPGELVTHTAQHRDLGEFEGRRVVVVGAGQSSLETAALLHEAGASVQVVARVPQLKWLDANPAELGLLEHLTRPVVPLCEGWKCVFWNTPHAFRMLPESYRITKAKAVLGPSGAWWLRDRVDGVVEVLAGRSIREAAAQGSGVRLVLDGPGQPTVDADHVIAGTGFRVDLARLPFLPEQLRLVVKTLNGHPVVSRAGQSSVPGLYFAGAPTVLSIGPSARFIAGTHTLCAVLARSLARRARAGRTGSGHEQQELVGAPGNSSGSRD
jgi:thioredoxin reductase